MVCKLRRHRCIELALDQLEDDEVTSFAQGEPPMFYSNIYPARVRVRVHIIGHARNNM